eukprot:1380895-Rhodomonas_salina.7
MNKQSRTCFSLSAAPQTLKSGSTKLSSCSFPPSLFSCPLKTSATVACRSTTTWVHCQCDRAAVRQPVHTASTVHGVAGAADIPFCR